MEPVDNNELFNHALMHLNARIKVLQKQMKDFRAIIEKAKHDLEWASTRWEAADAESGNLIWAVEVLEKKGEASVE